jgi:hypothetical protein
LAGGGRIRATPAVVNGPDFHDRLRESRRRFLAHARYVRANPLFDRKERERNLAIAEKVRSLISAAGDGQPLSEYVGAVSPLLSDLGQSYQLATHPQVAWLQEWATTDEGSFREALLAFSRPGVDAVDRFGSFVRTAQQGGRSHAIGHKPGTLLTLGSIFNFGLSPKALPVVREQTFSQLHRRLEGEPMPDGSLVDRYRYRISFASRVARMLEEAGVEIRDMLDAQALILLSRQPDFWAAGAVAERRAKGSAKASRPKRPARAPYLSVCACVGYEAPYLIEWLEFHRLVGVERFFLYINQDREAQRKLLAPYLEAGTVVLHDWPMALPQVPAYKHCLDEHRQDSRWIAFIDVDEFLFSPTGTALTDVLPDYEEWPGVGVNWSTFGPSGHKTKPPGLVIASYELRCHTRKDRQIKSIVDPLRTVDCATFHSFEYADGCAVDENCYPIRGAETTYVSSSRLRLNHYYTKSEAEWRERRRVRAGPGPLRDRDEVSKISAYERAFPMPERDILKFAPRLHARLRELRQMQPA